MRTGDFRQEYRSTNIGGSAFGDSQVVARLLKMRFTPEQIEEDEKRLGDPHIASERLEA